MVQEAALKDEVAERVGEVPDEEEAQRAGGGGAGEDEARRGVGDEDDGEGGEEGDDGGLVEEVGREGRGLGSHFCCCCCCCCCRLVAGFFLFGVLGEGGEELEVFVRELGFSTVARMIPKLTTLMWAENRTIIQLKTPGH